MLPTPLLVFYNTYHHSNYANKNNVICQYVIIARKHILVIVDGEVNETYKWAMYYQPQHFYPLCGQINTWQQTNRNKQVLKYSSNAKLV